MAEVPKGRYWEFCDDSHAPSELKTGGGVAVPPDESGGYRHFAPSERKTY